jgi:hypothetical protein
MNDIWGNQFNGNNGYNNNGFGYNRPFLQRYEIIKVHGEEGAKSFRMAPNSSTILADDTGALIWLAQTDGAGYLTVTPYDILPHQVKPPINVEDLAQRLAQLEEKVNAKQSTSQSSKQPKRQQQLQQQNTDTAV